MAEKDKKNADKQESYVEVIGDTVYGKHLIFTIIISISFSLGLFYLGKFIFTQIAPENMVQSYSLLLGIAGSLIALLVNALLFKPKRKLLETSSTNEELSIVYQDLQLDLEVERESILNDPITTQEMKEQGIYDMFFADKKEGKE